MHFELKSRGGLNIGKSINKSDFKNAIEAIDRAAFETLQETFKKMYPGMLVGGQIPEAEMQGIRQSIQVIRASAPPEDLVKDDTQVDIDGYFQHYLHTFEKFNYANSVGLNISFDTGVVTGVGQRGALEHLPNVTRFNNNPLRFPAGENHDIANWAEKNNYALIADAAEVQQILAGKIRSNGEAFNFTRFPEMMVLQKAGQEPLVFETGIKEIAPVYGESQEVSGFTILDGDGHFSKFDGNGESYVESTALANALTGKGTESVVYNRTGGGLLGYGFNDDGTKNQAEVGYEGLKGDAMDYEKGRGTFDGKTAEQKEKEAKDGYEKLLGDIKKDPEKARKISKKWLKEMFEILESENQNLDQIGHLNEIFRAEEPTIPALPQITPEEKDKLKGYIPELLEISRMAISLGLSLKEDFELFPQKEITDKILSKKQQKEVVKNLLKNSGTGLEYPDAEKLPDITKMEIKQHATASGSPENVLVVTVQGGKTVQFGKDQVYLPGAPAPAGVPTADTGLNYNDQKAKDGLVGIFGTPTAVSAAPAATPESAQAADAVASTAPASNPSASSATATNGSGANTTPDSPNTGETPLQQAQAEHAKVQGEAQKAITEAQNKVTNETDPVKKSEFQKALEKTKAEEGKKLNAALQAEKAASKAETEAKINASKNPTPVPATGTNAGKVGPLGGGTTGEPAENTPTNEEAPKGKIFEDVKNVTGSTEVSTAPKGTLIESPEPDKLALTFDVCSHYHGNEGAGEESPKTKAVVASLQLIATKTTYPVTLFVTGKSLKSPSIKAEIEKLAKLPHVSIQSHGDHHDSVTAEDEKPNPSYVSKTTGNAYVERTGNLEKAYDEMATGAQKISTITGKPVTYFRSAGLDTDEKSVNMAKEMGLTMTGETTGANDGGGTKTTELSKGKELKPGNIYIGHAVNFEGVAGVKAVYEQLEKDNISTVALGATTAPATSASNAQQQPETPQNTASSPEPKPALTRSIAATERVDKNESFKSLKNGLPAFFEETEIKKTYTGVYTINDAEYKTAADAVITAVKSNSKSSQEEFVAGEADGKKQGAAYFHDHVLFLLELKIRENRGFNFEAVKDAPPYKEILDAFSDLTQKTTVEGWLKGASLDMAGVKFYCRPRSGTHQNNDNANLHEKLLNTDGQKIALEFYNQHKATLQKAAITYSVPAEIIVATLQKETDFGKNQGDHNILSTLNGIVSNYFVPITKSSPWTMEKTPEQRKEDKQKEAKQRIIELFKYCLSKNVNPDTFQGGEVGAYGIPQFMPDKFHLAVDGDDDRKADLKNMDDAIMSIANFYKSNEWNNTGS
ncbi:MAG: lytic murein transglycosylase [Candidatus Peregrinibacteria bacterium]